MTLTTICTLLLLISSAPLLVSCRSTSLAEEHDQIVKTAIELADKYYQGARYMDAISVYDRALEQVDDHRLYFNKALVLCAMKSYMEAAQLCGEGFERYPHIISFKKAQAAYLRLAQDSRGCYEAYRQVLELDPYDTETRFLLIDIYIEDGLLDDAYRNALVLWDQGYQDGRTAGYLNALDEERWQTVHGQLGD